MMEHLSYRVLTNFYGRSLFGYAKWSLSGANQMRLNLNVIWRRALHDGIRVLPGLEDKEGTCLRPKFVVRFLQALFI